MVWVECEERHQACSVGKSQIETAFECEMSPWSYIILHFVPGDEQWRSEMWRVEEVVRYSLWKRWRIVIVNWGCLVLAVVVRKKVVTGGGPSSERSLIPDDKLNY